MGYARKNAEAAKKTGKNSSATKKELKSTVWV